jgi:hypothetical protein
MKRIFAIAVPILPGKTAQWKNFVSELKGKRSEEFVESRKRLGVRERTFLQSTPNGDIVVVTLEGNDPAGSFKTFGNGTDPFTKWFIGQVKEIHGIDLTSPNPGPMPELMIDSMEEVFSNSL